MNRSSENGSTCDNKYQGLKLQFGSIFLLVCLIALFWIARFIQFPLFLYSYDTASRVLDFIIIPLTWVVIPICGLFVFVKLFKKSPNKNHAGFRKVLMLIALFVLMYGHITLNTYFNSSLNQLGAGANIISKQIDDNECYFTIAQCYGIDESSVEAAPNHYIRYIKNKFELIKLNCSKEDYDKLIPDELVSYSIDYRYIRLFGKGYAVLKSIGDIDHPLDNRGKLYKD